VSSHPFTLHHDRKTSPFVVRSRSKGWEARVANAISFPAGPVEVGGSCPGASMRLAGPGAGRGPCDACYFERMTGPYGAMETMSARNMAAAEALIAEGGASALADAFTAAVGEMVAKVDRHRVRTGRDIRPMWRWMSGGDVWRDEVALAIAMTAERFPGVPMWCPTRSFIPGADHVRELVAAARFLPHLKVSLSVDSWNVDHAARYLARYPWVGYAHLDDGSELERAVAARLEVVTGGRRALRCPATGKWAHDGRGTPFVVPFTGRRDMDTAADGRGACSRCTACYGAAGVQDVSFAVHGGAPSPATFRRKIRRAAVSAPEPVAVVVRRAR
jgi:hypothetical protein